MRYPAGHKDEVRKKIVHAASRALRRHGLAGISIPDLMKEVGLTHGGFYSHFRDRDELVAEAVRAAADETAQAVLSAGELAEALGRYLSPSHLDHPEAGCVLAALGSEGAKQPARVKNAFGHVARGFLRLMEARGGTPAAACEVSDEALVRAATVVGAVMLGRLVQDRALAGRLLDAARNAATN